MGAHSKSGIDDITPAWLTDVYTDAGLLKDHCVTDVELSNVGVGRGYVSQTVMIKATYSDSKTDCPASAVAKIPSIVGFPEDYKLGLLGALMIPINGAKISKELVPPDESAPEIEHQQFREAEVAMNALIQLIAERSIHAVMDNGAGDVL